MSHIEQKIGMGHIADLKNLALILWKEYDLCQEMWIDCVEAALLQHRLDMKKQYDNKDFREKNKDRRTEQEKLAEEITGCSQEELIQHIRDAEGVFDLESEGYSG